MAGCHQQLKRHGFEWTLGDGEGQGSLACCSPWGCKESDRGCQDSATEQQQDLPWLGGWGGIKVFTCFPLLS